ncbi:hypothetical protein GGS26DRAFT_145176 [Hypomontagnella submonticulosa]|nr:hypothetical protein GGS26DRAFT_145176 [Hypomontagnella submonticulosa]
MYLHVGNYSIPKKVAQTYYARGKCSDVRCTCVATPFEAFGGLSAFRDTWYPFTAFTSEKLQSFQPVHDTAFLNDTYTPTPAMTCYRTGKPFCRNGFRQATIRLPCSHRDSSRSIVHIQSRQTTSRLRRGHEACFAPVRGLAIIHQPDMPRRSL